MLVAIFAVLVCLAGCSSTSKPPPAPVTVTSVDGWGLLTLSTGNRVYDTSEPTHLGPGYDSCEADLILRAARGLMVGRKVVRLNQAYSGPFGTAPAGYVPVNISIVGFDSRGMVEDFNYWTEARENSGAVEACRPAETATSEPTTSSAPSSSSSGDVDVDVDDDDHESRFCRRHWWC